MRTFMTFKPKEKNLKNNSSRSCETVHNFKQHGKIIKVSHLQSVKLQAQGKLTKVARARETHKSILPKALENIYDF